MLLMHMLALRDRIPDNNSTEGPFRPGNSHDLRRAMATDFLTVMNPCSVCLS